MGKGKNASAYSDQKNWSNTYLTDPALVRALGPFHCDPCCPPRMPWKTAKRMLTIKEDGLNASWGRGRVWMNPPYRGTLAWCRRLAEHGRGIALLNGRSTETRATHTLLEVCSAFYVFDRRLTWYKVTGKPYAQKWFPSLLIGLGGDDFLIMRKLPQRGFPGQLFIRSKIN